MTTATPAIDLVSSMMSTMTTENEPFSSSVFTQSSDENTSMVSNFVTTGSMTNMTTAITDTALPFRFDDPTQRAIIAVVGCIVAVVGITGNVLVILAVILSRKLQTRTNAFVVNLAAADLVTCILAPLHAATLLSMSGWPSHAQHMDVCAVIGVIGSASLGCSIMSLAAIAINRYVLITKTMATYRSIYTPKKIAAMLVFTWVYPGVLCLLPLFGIGKWGYSYKYKTCSLDTSHETSDLFGLLGSALIYPIPLIVLFVCYYKIYRHVTEHLKKLASRKIELTDQSSSSNANTSQLHNSPPPASSLNKRQVEITKNLFYVVCAFVVFLAPFAIALMVPPSDPVVPWTSMIVIFNSGVNPIIYGAKHPHFKEVFRHMLRCRCYMIPEPSSCLRKMRSR